MNLLPLRVFILAKNEEANIHRCLNALAGLAVEVTVLDSGSTDKTREIASQFTFVRVEDYKYVNHLTAYNDLCTRPAQPGQYIMIIDSDIIITQELQREITDLVTKGDIQVAQAPIVMWWCGRPLKHGSMYPPKPFLFKTGASYFVAVGRGEQLLPEVSALTTNHQMIHDDRKPYLSYLQSQVRYTANSLAHFQRGTPRWRDKLRYRTPLAILLTPLYSFFIRLGFLSGKIGFIYALDRLIAEAIFFRQAMASRFVAERDEPQKAV